MSDEVFNELIVGNIGVKVILVVLKDIHLLLNEVIVSYSWESEGFVIKLPSCYSRWACLKSGGDFHGFAVVSFIKGS